MSMFRFSDSFGMFDSTPVENIFVEEFMPRAPGEYVKVYLYGLSQCYHPGAQTGMETAARALGTDLETVVAAFSYWEKQGVVRRISDKPPVFQYNNLKAMLVRGSSPEDEALYRFRDFNNALQGIFGTRLLTPAEYSRASEWIEELGMNEEAALLLVRGAVSDRGPKVSFNYLDQVASAWAKAGISTKEAAEEYLRVQGSKYQGARKVLGAMGVRRAPTIAEEKLYQKWTDSWEFTHAAVEAALSEMTKTATPNFAYLDKVLEGARGRGEKEAGDMQASRARREEESAPVRDVLSALGAGGGVTDDLRSMYKSFVERGFDRDAILLAARHARRRGGRSMQDVQGALESFAKLDLYTGEAIDRHMNQVGAQRDAALTLKALCGEEGPIGKGDLRLYRRMEATGLPAQVLELAAQYARGAKEPMAFAAKIAENWKAAGVKSVEDARREHEGHEAKGQDIPKARSRLKEVSGQKFTQREYSESEWAAFAMDMDALEGGEG